MLSIIRSIFAAPQAPTLAELAQGTCALPAPKVMVKVPKAEKVPDAFIEREETNTWGFRDVSGGMKRQNSVPELTESDVNALIERECWGGKAVQDLNIKCKELWFDGKTMPDVAKLLKRSPSWVEKRFGAFSAATNNG